MSDTPVKLTAGTLPPNFCPASEQERLDEYVSVIEAVVEGEFKSYNFGPVEPDADHRDAPWLQTAPDGSPIGWRIYFGGQWIPAQRHPIAPGVVVMWWGDLADIPLIDGGSGPNPFWVVCDGQNGTPDLRCRVPMCASVGTVPALGAGLTARNKGDLIGEETHKLIADELAKHKHDVTTISNGNAGGGHRAQWFSGDTSSTTDATVTSQENTSAENGHNNIQPSLALWMIMKTGRLY